MHNFNYQRPATVADAAKALASAGDGKIIAGGMTLVPTLKQRLAAPSDLIDLGGIADLRGIKAEGDGLTIGAMTRHAEVAASSAVKSTIPALAHLAELIGDRQVRNRGTIGGSLANNDPAADYPAAALALGATIRTNKREIAADSYFQGLFDTALEEGEIITAVHFPKPEKAAYQKFAQPASRFALIGVFVAKTKAGIRVAVTGGGNGVFRAKDVEAALTANFTPQAAKAVRVNPAELNGDLHGTPEYRAALISTLAARAVAAC